MDDWQPLSVRRGKRKPTEPHQGVPPHLLGPLTNWVTDTFFHRSSYTMVDADMLRYLASMHEIVVPAGVDDSGALRTVIAHCTADQDLCLDFVDSSLKFRQFTAETLDDLRVILFVAKSVWTVSEDNKSLVEKTDPTAVRQYQMSRSPSEVASEHLDEAWDKAYGRQPDPSDAWDHAIKAVEAVLIPIVCPKKEKANLGGVAGDLKSAPHTWRLELTSDGIGGVETLEAMLRLMWPNPDRHEGVAPKRAPTQQEAEGVVHLAITVVQWARMGLLRKL